VHRAAPCTRNKQKKYTKIISTKLSAARLYNMNVIVCSPNTQTKGASRSIKFTWDTYAPDMETSVVLKFIHLFSPLL
jgi:hypothetical protein